MLVGMAPSFHAQITEAVPLGTDGHHGAPWRDRRTGSAMLQLRGPGAWPCVPRAWRPEAHPGSLPSWNSGPVAMATAASGCPPPARFPLFLKIRHFQEEPERVGRESRQQGCPALLPPYNTMASSGSSTEVFHLSPGFFRDSQNSLKRCLAFPLLPQALGWEAAPCGPCISPAWRPSRHTLPTETQLKPC